MSTLLDRAIESLAYLPPDDADALASEHRAVLDAHNAGRNVPQSKVFVSALLISAMLEARSRATANAHADWHSRNPDVPPCEG